MAIIEATIGEAAEEEARRRKNRPGNATRSVIEFAINYVNNIFIVTILIFMVSFFMNLQSIKCDQNVKVIKLKFSIYVCIISFFRILIQLCN